MIAQELISELYSLFKKENHNGSFVKFPPRTRRIMVLLRELNDVFDLPLLRLEEILQELVSHDEISYEIIDQTLVSLADAAALVHTLSKFEEKNGEGDHSHSHKIQCEEIDLDDVDAEILNRALEKAQERIKIQEPEKNQPVANTKHTPVVANRECYEYVKSHIYLPLGEGEFCNIETGFRLIWDHAKGQMLGDYDFKRAVDQYLASIESPIDRGKMAKIVDLMLEYQEEIGEWGHIEQD